MVKPVRGSTVKAVECGQGEIPREQKPRRAPAFGERFTPSSGVSNPRGEKSLEGEPQIPAFCWMTGNVRKAA
jgi:hypothetical protein